MANVPFHGVLACAVMLVPFYSSQAATSTSGARENNSKLVIGTEYLKKFISYKIKNKSFSSECKTNFFRLNKYLQQMSKLSTCTGCKKTKKTCM